MNRMNKTGVAVTVGALAMTLAGCGGDAGGADGSVDLRYAFYAPAQSFPGVQMEEWVDRLDAEAETEVKVELFPGGTLLGAGDIFDGVTEGVVDVGLDSPAYDVGRFPLSSVITLPVGFACAQSASMAMLDLIDEYEPDEFEGYKVLTAFTTEPAYIQSKEPVTGLDDLDGLELRTSGALTPALESLGASPVGMPMPEVAQGLQTGVISGYASSREVLKDFGLADQVSYVTDYAFGVSNTFVAVMEQSAFDALPEDVKTAMDGLREEMSTFASEYHDNENVGGALEFATTEKGVETVELAEGQEAEWDAALEPLVSQWLEDADGNGFEPQEVLDRATELAEQYNAEAGCTA